jgi:methionyl-tRNA formyltransferase
LKLAPSAVKKFAEGAGLPVYQPGSLKSADALARLREARPDVLVVAAYGMILPPAILEAAPHGALNIHASLLPRWRGAAPIQRAILAGDRETGITITRMDAGLDTGPMLMQQATPIGPEDDAGSLHDRLAALGAQMMVEALVRLERGALKGDPQPAEGATYAAKIRREDTVLDWGRSAADLERAVRAFRPVPGASTTLQGEPLKIWKASAREGVAEPGAPRVADGELLVGCGSGLLSIEELQKAGGRRLPVSEFLRGSRLDPGTRLG